MAIQPGPAGSEQNVTALEPLPGQSSLARSDTRTAGHDPREFGRCIGERLAAGKSSKGSRPQFLFETSLLGQVGIVDRAAQRSRMRRVDPEICGELGTDPCDSSQRCCGGLPYDFFPELRIGQCPQFFAQRGDCTRLFASPGSKSKS